MKTMILTDLRIMSTSMAPITMFFFVLSLFCGFGGENAYMPASMFMSMFVMSYAISTVSSDNTNNWQLARLALPISRKQIVMGRYVVGLILLVVGFALSCLVSITTDLLFPLLGSTLDGQLTDPDLIMLQVASSFLAGAFMLILLAVTFAVTFKFNTRTAIMIVPALVILFIIGTVFLFPTIEGAFPGLTTFVEDSLLGTSLCLLAFGLVTYAVSMAIALGLYRTREL